MAPMKTKWLYKQIIDLEYFFHQDATKDSSELHQRDRTIFLNLPAEQDVSRESAPRDLIKFWLQQRLAVSFASPTERSPGTIFRDGYLVSRNLAIIIGLIVGLLAGFSFFTYTGTTPINVFQFLLLFVLSQLGLVTILLLACLLRPLLPGLKIPSFYSFIFQGMLTRLITFSQKHWLNTMPADKRASVNQAIGIFKARHAIYGSLFYWPLFGLAQLFGIGFNLGLLSSTLLKIFTSDLAFGWQSTMQFSATAIHKAVALAALPWSWFVSETTSYPSLSAIEGSRIILKDGIYHLTSNNLVAWWPFLIFCLLFYGLLLRLLLLGFGRFMEGYSLNKLQLETPACQALIRRMQTPLVSTQATPEVRIENEESSQQEKSPVTPSAPRTLSGQVILIPDDIFPQCRISELASQLTGHGLAIAETHNFMAGYEEDQQLKDVLAHRSWQTGQGILILMEGWMVPLVDFLSYLKELRLILPPKTTIHLGLVGRPKETIFTPVAPEDFSIWKKKIDAIGDPYLTLFSIIS